MKAEHRKELQTNTLADMLGRTVRNVRGGGTGVSWRTVIIVLVLVLAVGIFWWVKKNQSRGDAELWVKLDDNTSKNIEQLFKESNDTNQGKAATLMLAYEIQYEGVRLVGGGPQMQPAGVQRLQQSQALYVQAQKLCEGNDEWMAEAKYGEAAATEALTVEDPENLTKAKNLYADLAKGDLGKTGYGMLAAKRLEQLNNQTEQAAIAGFYRDFNLNAFKMKAK
jgi:hypothetical protein